jgi:hypothetical protein
MSFPHWTPRNRFGQIGVLRGKFAEGWVNVGNALRHFNSAGQRRRERCQVRTFLLGIELYKKRCSLSAGSRLWELCLAAFRKSVIKMLTSLKFFELLFASMISPG